MRHARPARRRRSRGDSRTLVIHGEPGIGKTALLEYLASRAQDCQVLRAAGAPSESELALSALHHVCQPLLGRLEDLPAPQRDALRITFGVSQGPPPDLFLVGLAILGLLSRSAAERPLICLVDDADWVNRVSAQLFAFVGRRLAAGPVGLVFALAPRLNMLFCTGELTAAEELIEQMEAARAATGRNLKTYGVLRLAALRGTDSQTPAQIEAAVAEASRSGEGFGISASNRTRSC